jgi:hypothetical protein
MYEVELSVKVVILAHEVQETQQLTTQGSILGHSFTP